MLYNKKTRLFRKLFSKEKSSPKGHNDKCHYKRFDDLAHHNNHQLFHDGTGSNCQNEIPLLKIDQSCLSSVENVMVPNSADSTKVTSSSSALLAAKLSCDEWGIQRRQNFGHATSTKNIPVPQPLYNLTSSPSIKPKMKNRVIQVRNGNSNRHPSYKPPTLQRSLSMKERREAKEKSKKFGRFTSSLYCIQEVPEIGTIGVNTQ